MWKDFNLGYLVRHKKYVTDTAEAKIDEQSGTGMKKSYMWARSRNRWTQQEEWWWNFNTMCIEQKTASYNMGNC